MCSLKEMQVRDHVTNLDSASESTGSWKSTWSPLQVYLVPNPDLSTFLLVSWCVNHPYLFFSRVPVTYRSLNISLFFFLPRHRHLRTLLLPQILKNQTVMYWIPREFFHCKQGNLTQIAFVKDKLVGVLQSLYVLVLNMQTWDGQSWVNEYHTCPENVQTFFSLSLFTTEYKVTAFTAVCKFSTPSYIRGWASSGHITNLAWMKLKEQ